MNGRKLIPGDPLLEPAPPDDTMRRDTLDEVFSGVVLRRLARINAIVMRSGEPLEGNIFYPEYDDRYAQLPPAESLAPARRNVEGGRFKERLLEVGGKPGHGALIAPSASINVAPQGAAVLSVATGRGSAAGATRPARVNR